jgi:sulfur carrier protein
MKARVNGVDHDLVEGATIQDLLRLLAIPVNGVAVAVDGAVVPRAEHPRTVLADGADVEVLTAVQGG